MSDLVSNIRIFPTSKSDTFKANGRAVLGNLVEVSFKIINGKNGLFVSYPSQAGKEPGKDGKIPYYPDVKIVDEDTKKQVEAAILAEYNNKLTPGTGTTTSTGNGTAKKKTLPF